MEPDNQTKLDYLRDRISPEKKEEVEAWLGVDPAHEKELSDVARIYYAMRTRERIDSRDVSAAYQKVWKKIERRALQVWLQRWSVAAACFLGGVLLASLFFFSREGRTGLPEQGERIVQSNAGVRTQFNLPDGSLVYLNAGSYLSYPASFGEGERRVKLSGEAYFEVKRDEAHPFVVSVREDRLRVKVLGTSFNIQAYEGDRTIGTTLVSGSVALEVAKDNYPIRKTTLSPSEKAVWNWETDAMSIRRVDTGAEIAWREGRLVFKDLPLPEVLQRLSHYYNVQFEVVDPIINSYRFTGTFDNKQLSQVLDYLSLSSQIGYKISSIQADDSEQKQQTIVRLISK